MGAKVRLDISTKPSAFSRRRASLVLLRLYVPGLDWSLVRGVSGYSLHRWCTAANSRRSFATAANMSEEFILSIKFIVLVMVT